MGLRVTVAATPTAGPVPADPKADARDHRTDEEGNPVHEESDQREQHRHAGTLMDQRRDRGSINRKRSYREQTRPTTLPSA